MEVLPLRSQCFHITILQKYEPNYITEAVGSLLNNLYWFNFILCSSSNSANVTQRCCVSVPVCFPCFTFSHRWRLINLIYPYRWRAPTIEAMNYFFSPGADFEWKPKNKVVSLCWQDKAESSLTRRIATQVLLVLPGRVASDSAPEALRQALLKHLTQHFKRMASHNQCTPFSFN